MRFQNGIKSKNIFVFGNSGSGKSTLAAKIASYLSDARLTKKINFIDVSSSSTGSSDVLRSYSRVLGFSIMDYKNFNFNDNHKNNEEINVFDFSGDMNTCIAIRTMVVKDGRVYFQSGAGIVIDSNPDKEFEETIHKAQAINSAIDLAEKGLVK